MTTVYTLAFDVVKAAKTPEILTKARELFVGIAFLYTTEKVKKAEIDDLLFAISEFIKTGKVSTDIYNDDLLPVSKMMFDRIFQSEIDTQDISNCILVNLLSKK